MNFYSHNIGDFANVAQYLDDASLGVFMRLIDKYMLDEKPIKTQWVSFAFQNERHERAMRVLENLFEQTEEGWIYAPMAEVIENYRVNAEKNRENGRKGGRPRKVRNPNETQTKPNETQSVSGGFSNETQTKPNQKATNNHKPITNNQEINNPLTPLRGVVPTVATETAEKPKRKRAVAVSRPEDVDAQVWADFETLRKAKRAPITATAISGLRKEAEKAGLTLEGALRVCIKNGWQGFEASWVSKDDRSEYLPNSRFKRQECRNYDLPI